MPCIYLESPVWCYLARVSLMILWTKCGQVRTRGYVCGFLYDDVYLTHYCRNCTQISKAKGNKTRSRMSQNVVPYDIVHEVLLASLKMQKQCQDWLFIYCLFYDDMQYDDHLTRAVCHCRKCNTFWQFGVMTTFILLCSHTLRIFAEQIKYNLDVKNNCAIGFSAVLFG